MKTNKILSFVGTLALLSALAVPVAAAPQYDDPLPISCATGSGNLMTCEQVNAYTVRYYNNSPTLFHGRAYYDTNASPIYARMTVSGSDYNATGVYGMGARRVNAYPANPLHVIAGYTHLTPSYIYQPPQDEGFYENGDNDVYSYLVPDGTYYFIYGGSYDVMQAYTYDNQAASWWGPGFELYLSTVPFVQTCFDDYVIVDSYGNFPLDPTLESPVGAPTDNQKQTVASGQIYVIQISGGPWDDGTDERYDAAISWDGSAYSSLMDLANEALCVVYDPVHPDLMTIFLIAQSDSFYIRVNDTAGNFGDNTDVDPESPLTYTLGLALLSPDSNTCEDNYSYDPVEDLVASVTVYANVENVLTTDEIVSGDWYVIEIEGGEWFDDGAGPYTEMDYLFWFDYPITQFGPTDFNPFADGSPGFWCATADGTKFLVQATQMPELYLRVHDTELTFEDNTGSLDVNIYRATFYRYLESCEFQFDLGDLVYSDYVPAIAENGKLFATSASLGEGEPVLSYGLTPGGWYVMDTTDGPWGYMGLIHSEQFARSYEVAVNSDGSWVELSEWPESSCTVPLDGLGHLRTYFQVPDTGAIAYRLRVNDTAGWDNNVDGMGFDLYHGIDLGDTPDGSCDYTHSGEPGAAYIPPTASDGVWLNTLDINTIYYLEILDGYAWQEYSGGDDNTGIQITSDGGQTWHDLPSSFFGTLCYETSDEGHLGIYFRTGSSGLGYKLRVDSIAASPAEWADNTGSMYFKLYNATAGPSIDPWDTCLDDWGLTVFDEFEWINVHDENGTYPLPTTSVTQVNDFWSQLDILCGSTEWLSWLENLGISCGTVQLPTTGLASGFYYVIEIKEGPWDDGETTSDHYDAALSSDNGETWHPIAWDNPILECGELDQMDRYWKALFYVDTGEIWKIRVNDEDTVTFDDNGGNLAYKLYGALPYTTGVSIPQDPVIIDNSNWGGGDICTQACIRPDSLLEVGGWIEYSSCSFKQFIAWCPRHTEMILGLVNSFNGKEPFATLSEINTLVGDARMEVESYNWDEGPASIITGESSSTFEGDLETLIFPDYTGGPWDGGDLVEFGSSQPLSYYTNCSLALANNLPEKLALGVCFTSSWFLETGASLWIQIGLDLMAAFAILKMMTGNIKSLINLMTGGTTFQK